MFIEIVSILHQRYQSLMNPSRFISKESICHCSYISAKMSGTFYFREIGKIGTVARKNVVNFQKMQCE